MVSIHLEYVEWFEEMQDNGVLLCSGFGCAVKSEYVNRVIIQPSEKPMKYELTLVLIVVILYVVHLRVQTHSMHTPTHTVCLHSLNSPSSYTHITWSSANALTQYSILSAVMCITLDVYV